MAQGGRILEALWHRGFPDEREAEDAGGWAGGLRGTRERAGVRSSGKGPMLHLDSRVRGESHRARLDATGISPACGIGASPMSGTPRRPGVGGRASADARACGRSFIGQRPDATLGFEDSRGNSHRARLDATLSFGD